MADARSLTFCSCFHPPLLPPPKPLLLPSLHLPSSSYSSHSKRSFKTLCSRKTSSSSSQDSAISGSFGIISTTKHSDGSVLFRFGEANEISDNVKIEEESIVKLKGTELENVDNEDVRSSKEEAKSHNELVDSVKEQGMFGEVSSENASGMSERSPGDAVSDVKSSDEMHVPETIYFKILTPVNISELECAVKEEVSGSNSNFTTSAIGSRLDTVSFVEFTGEESKDEIASEAAEPDVEVQSSFASLAATTAEDHTMQQMEENSTIDNGGKGENPEVVPVSNSLEASVILDDELTPVVVDEELKEEPTHDAVDERPTENGVDEEPTHAVMDEEQVKQPTASAEDDGSFCTELDHDSTPSTMGKELTSNELDEEPVEQQSHNAIAKEPSHSAVEEEPSVNVVDEETTHVVVAVEPVDNEVADDLKMLDGNLLSLYSAEETTEADGESSSNGNVLISHLAESQMSEATATREEVSTSRFFLFSGTASLTHPSKALTGREDAYFVDRNWLGIADGVKQWSLEGFSNGPYAKELIENCGKIVADSKSISITGPVEVLDKAAKETESSGSSTALIAYFDGQALHVANIGDSRFLVIRNGSIFKKSSPTEHEFSFPLQIEKNDNPSELMEGYVIDLEEGDVIITATDGLFDNLYELEIVSIVSNSLEASLKPQEVAEQLAARAQEVGKLMYVRSPFADAAKAAGYVGYTGGRLDNVTVIVSLLLERSTCELE